MCLPDQLVLLLQLCQWGLLLCLQHQLAQLLLWGQLHQLGL